MKSIFRLCVLVFVGAIAFGAPVFPAAPVSELEGSWTAEQTGADAGASKQATLTFVRGGAGSLNGTMRVGAGEMPLFDVREMGPNVSFTLVIPGTPYVSIRYVGARTGDEIRLVGSDENRAVYTLTARRIAPAAPPVQAAPAPVPPPPPVVAAPRVPAARPPASAPPPIASLQAPPAATASGRLDGNWTAGQASPGSAAPIQANLVFTGNRGVMHVGADDWPLFDVRDTGADVAFTLVIPGTPYITIHYAGTVAGNELQLAGLDEGQGVFHLTARRASAASAPAIATVLPPLPAPTPPAAQTEPRLALLNPPPAAPSAGPPPKLPLPPLRDVPPNNLVKTPPMGWASRQKLGPDIEDDDIRQAAESLEETDLRAAGYLYVEVDEGWQGARDANGVLHAGAKFPDMKALGDYIHSKQLKFGLAVSAAPKSCGGFEGSYGHEAEDAKLFASWGVDYHRL